MIRIVELCTDKLPCPPPKGGAIETYVYGISKAMVMQGAEVHLVTIEKRYDVDYGNAHVHVVNLTTSIASKLRKLFAIISHPNSNIPYLSIKLLELFNEIENLYGRIDVIHSHYFTTSLATLIYKYIKGGDVVVGHLHNEPKPNKINKLLIELYDLHLAVSKYVKNRTIELLKVSPDKIGIVYNAVDTEFFKPCKPSEKTDRRKKFGVEDNDFVIAFIGRIVPEKGLHHLILASKILKQKGYKFKLLVAGPLGHFDIEILEGYPSGCFNLIHHLGLSNNVKYIGRPEREELRDIYCASDLIAVPSLWEDPAPTVVLEAMAMGRPVVAYASGGIPELIPPYSGIVIKGKSPRLLAEAIEMVMQGVFSFNESATVEWAREKFSYIAVARKLLKTFERLKNQS
jgi:glycosyltransferase involved in cell wall biosynthesis